MNKRMLFWLLGIIVALVIIYFIANYFISQKADKQVQQIVAQLRHAPNVQSLNYQKVNVSVFDLLSHQVNVQDIRLVFKQAPQQPLLIHQLSVANYQQSASGVPLHFKLSAEGIRLTSLKRALIGAVKTYQHRQAQPGSPIIVLLKTPAEVAILKSKNHVLWHGQLPAGKHDIDTRHFPVGTYEVTVITQPAGGKADGHKQLFVKADPHNVALPLIDKYVPEGSLLSANLTLQYDADHTRLDTTTTLFWKGQKIADQTSSLHPFQIDRRITDLQAVAEAIEHTFIEHLDSHIALHFTLPVPKNSSHFLWKNLHELGYQSLPVDITFNGQLDAKSNRITNQGVVYIANAGKLIWSGQNLMGKQLSLGHAWMSMLHPQKSSLLEGDKYQPKIVSEVLTYQDQSLVTRIINLVAKRLQQTPAQVKQNAINMLTVLTEKFAIPQVATTIQAIDAFLQKPNQITFALKPSEPFNFQIPEQFVKQAQQQHQALSQKLALVPEGQHAAIQAEYDKRLYQQIATLLDRMGYQVHIH